MCKPHAPSLGPRPSIYVAWLAYDYVNFAITGLQLHLPLNCISKGGWEGGRWVFTTSRIGMTAVAGGCVTRSCISGENLKHPGPLMHMACVRLVSFALTVLSFMSHSRTSSS